MTPDFLKGKQPKNVQSATGKIASLHAAAPRLLELVKENRNIFVILINGGVGGLKSQLEIIDAVLKEQVLEK